MKTQAQERIYVPTQVADLPINSQVTVDVVSDPHSDTGDRIQVFRSLRDDPLAGMLARRQIDQAQYEAGRKWQYLHEASTIGAIRAIDPCKEAVDGGKPPESITDRQVKAFRELREAYAALGQLGGRLVFMVLGERRSMTEVARFIMGGSSELEIKYAGRRFRECLETLAIHWGFAPRKWS